MGRFFCPVLFSGIKGKILSMNSVCFYVVNCENIDGQLCIRIFISKRSHFIQTSYVKY